MPEVPPLVVEGTPKPYQSNPKDENKQNAETLWRKKIEEVTQQFLQTSSTVRNLIQQVNTNPDCPQFTVEITFILNNPEGKGKDIDNLSKPVIDTLFYAPPPDNKWNKVLKPEQRKPTGVLFREVSDTHVYHLIAHKRRPTPDEKEHVIIRLSWTQL